MVESKARRQGWKLTGTMKRRRKMVGNRLGGGGQEGLGWKKE